MLKNLYLIDGNSYIYRAYHGIKGLSTSRGLPTNAIYGFTKILLKIINNKKPSAIAVVFDSPAPTKRHNIYEQYKAQRPEIPNDLLVQIPYIKKIIKALGIKTYEKQGYEADDILATLATIASYKGIDVYIVSADKDMLQIVNKNIKIYDPLKNLIIDKDYVLKKFGIMPERIAELMALTGDSIDNIPGVKGIGPKTAKEILSKHTLKEILTELSFIKNKRLRKLILENKDTIKMSFELAKVLKNVPIEFSIEDCVYREPHWQELLCLFRDLQFSSLIKILPASSINTEYKILDNISFLEKFLMDTKEIFLKVYMEKDIFSKAIGICIGKPNNIPLYIPSIKNDIISLMKSYLQNKEIKKIGHNLKNVIKFFKLHGITINGILEDIMIASYLLNPDRISYTLEDIGLEYLSIKKEKSSKKVDIKNIADFSSSEIILCMKLKDIILKKIKEEELEDVYYKIEMPLIEVLADMEVIGIKIDIQEIKRLQQEVSQHIQKIESNIYLMAGCEFNINSPKQLSAILFDKLGLKPKKKTKTGYSTEMGVLQELAKEHALPKEILSWRSLSKLKNTYIDILLKLINPKTSRIHTNFNQTVTATGRLSSSEPNLQNIPIKGLWGEKIRKAFIAEKGFLLMSADYSQIELRILAHLSGDCKLKKAFQQGKDIHAETAMELFNEVNHRTRRIAKAVNFGIIYGISTFGLSEATGVPLKESKKYIEKYFHTYSGVKKYSENVIQQVKKLGYVKTIFGRKRFVPEINSPNSTIRASGERIALNTLIQGSAADIIKKAMINVYHALKNNGCKSRIILQIHDELLIEVAEDEVLLVKDILKKEMETVIKLSVPLKVKINYGKNWAEAHA